VDIPISRKRKTVHLAILRGNDDMFVTVLAQNLAFEELRVVGCTLDVDFARQRVCLEGTEKGLAGGEEGHERGRKGGSRPCDRNRSVLGLGSQID